MPAILLVDDDKDTWATVRLALEPQTKVYPIGTLNGALNFLRNRSHEISGVIVDLNLTAGLDNFGRILLERLREAAMPCVIFSSSIASPTDAQRYENEFGVLGTIGKGSLGAESTYILEQLRNSVQRMIDISIEQLRERIRHEIDHELARRDALIKDEQKKSNDLIVESQRVAGKYAASRLAAAEAARIKEMTEYADRIRKEVMAEIAAAINTEELERVRGNILRSLGAL